ncbi:hypothetical protein HH310_28820 [Actinoplanes sp. TBRC 11911]|uniref:hypothetical protein n=1 Tax=Actinoplanes sp. TBRC 11911 TaxID=2729386 RepID=UPI00145F355F|nr:hypothetical protein [Actinoplanes sp. TBRC 11911]NMO55175.1 hypothetical protein [Actinoplanes sp. TBRC 11911]
MTSPQFDWKTRLGVRFTVNGTENRAYATQSFIPQFGSSAEPLHTVERTHVGMVSTPHNLTFTLSVMAIGPAVADLTALAFRGDPFELVMLEQDGNDWSYATVVMKQCYITSAAPGAATISGAPVATFSGFSLEAEVTDKNSATTKTPRNTPL